MTRLPIAVAAIAAVACSALTGTAIAQVGPFPPGQDFAATPMSSGGLSMPQARLAVAAPPMAAPAPAPMPQPKMKRKRKM